MSSLCILQIVEGAKVVKKWYGKCIQQNLQVCEVFSLFINFLLTSEVVDKYYTGNFRDLKMSSGKLCFKNKLWYYRILFVFAGKSR